MNIPKSLHTITAIAAVARATQQECLARANFYYAALFAAEILGYPYLADDYSDTHNLVRRAADTLAKDAAMRATYTLKKAAA